MAALAATDPYIGREIIGAIELRQLVGIGAMGRVYRGFQRGIDRDVAVKILHRELSANPAVVARFHREAKVASRLAHPNVVHVLLTGQLPDGAMYIVMEYLDGMSLQSALAASGGTMPVVRALHIALGLCEAAGEAHAQGIVHRDLKPENVMLVRRGSDPDFVKVLDFGIARLNWTEQSTGSAAGLIFGTARYISPEGAQGEAVGPPGDVYSIATILYQMLSGRTPFDAEQAVALLVQQIHDVPPPINSVARAGGVPGPIASVVMNNLAKKPQERSSGAREFARELVDAAARSGLPAQGLAPRSQAGTSAGGVPAAPDGGGNGTSRAVARTVYDAPLSSSPASATTSQDGRVQVQTEVAEPPPRLETARAAGPVTGVDATMDEQQPPPTPPPSRASSAIRTSAPEARSVSAIPTTPGAAGAGDSPFRRAVPLIVITCFLVGAVTMAIVVSRAGWLGGARGPALALDAMVLRANDALMHQRWDAPKGDNVRDITDEGLARWHNEPQLLRIRTLASGDIVKAARAKREEGSLAEALRLAKLAYQLDPSDDLAQKLAAETETQAQAPPTDFVPPLASARSAAAATVLGPKAMLDVSNAKPAAGQSVDFSAHVAGLVGAAPPKVEEPAFRVSGPGVAPATPIAGVDDGSGAFRTTYTFPQDGRFEVTFSARADGAPVRATRIVQVGAPREKPRPSASGGQPSVAPASSDKWL